MKSEMTPPQKEAQSPMTGSADASMLMLNKTVAGLIALSKHVVIAAERMQALDARAQSLHALMENIEAVAERTVVLSLNASIEAGRAGAEGRGFGIVASEIRKLSEFTRETAEQTRQSVAEISELSGHVFALLSQVASASRTQAVTAQSDAIKVMASKSACP